MESTIKWKYTDTQKGQSYRIYVAKKVRTYYRKPQKNENLMQQRTLKMILKSHGDGLANDDHKFLTASKEKEIMGT